MCGVYGIVKSSKFSISEAQHTILITMLSALNDTRGGMSNGYCDLSDTNNPKIEKHLGDISDYILDLVSLDCFFAHTRYATHGKVTEDNSHPFIQGNIIGAHNGVFSNHTDLNTKYNRSFDVDSQHAFQHIAEGKDLNDIQGYGTLEYFDKEEKNLYLCRLTGGVLSVCKVTDSQGNFMLIWSSSEDHLNSALMACDLYASSIHYKIEEGHVYRADLEEADLYKTDKKLNIMEKVVDWRLGSEANYTSKKSSKSSWQGHGNFSGSLWNFDNDIDDMYESDNYWNDKDIKQYEKSQHKTEKIGTIEKDQYRLEIEKLEEIQLTRDLSEDEEEWLEFCYDCEFEDLNNDNYVDREYNETQSFLKLNGK